MAQNSARNKELRKKIQNYSYSLNDVIGRGPNSVIFKGINEQTNELVILKVIEQKKINSKGDKQLLQNQIQILKKVNHINILQCYEVFNSINNCYIITEYCNGGSLEHLIKQRGKLTQSQIISIFKDIFLGFRTFVQAGYIHRNLNLSNVFLHNNIAKIGGFGSCVKAKTGIVQADLIIGEPNFTSPEALKEYKYSIKSDIWSLGLILYYMFHNRTPWQNSCEIELLSKINITHLALLKNIEEDTKDFIRKCLVTEEERRISYTDLIDHPFIQKTLMNYNMNVYLPKEKVEYLPKIINTTKQEKNMKFLVYWIQFLIKLWEMSGDKLKIIINKQIQMEKNSLQCCFNEDRNVYNIQKWQDLKNKKDYWKNFEECLKQYEEKISKIKKESEKILKRQNLPKGLAGNRKSIRQEAIYLYSIPEILKQCKRMSIELKSGIKSQQSQIISWEIKKLDYTISYYQLCCILLQDFSDIDNFVSKSYLELIVASESQQLEERHLDEIESKMKKLQIL